MDSFLYEAASQGDLIITVNDRLARHLSRQYDLSQQSAGRNAWLRPEILSLNAWLKRNRHLLAEADGLLNQVQSLYLWEMIVEKDAQRAGNLLLQSQQTARRAHQAHQLLLRHSVDFHAEDGAEDHRAFLRWRHAWQQLASARGWRDSAELPWLLATAVAEGRIHRPQRIVMAGFDEFPPDLQHLCATLKDRGATVDTWQPQPVSGGSCHQVSGLDPADEVRRCARWIRRILSDRPYASIGVVAPQLEVYQSLIESIFLEELDPSALLSGDESPQVFNMSLGHGLQGEGVIAAALELLRARMKLSFTTLSGILLSPYLVGAGEEGAARALLERELRRTGRVEWSLTRLRNALAALTKKTGRPVPGVVALFDTLHQDLTTRGRRLPGDWAEHFARMLARLGWPGDRGLSSREHQAVQQFREALGDMASLDRISRPLERDAATGLLVRLVVGREFQPEGGDCQVQVLGALEASGLTFDCLWVLGLHDAALPRPSAPNPFIPLPIQRRERMQRADAERERLFAAQVADRLFHAASDVVLSSPLQDDSGCLRPSPLIAAFPSGEPLLADSHAPMRLLQAARPVLDQLPDGQAPALCSQKPFSGGTGILKDQALCPFRAFAHYRLNSEGLDTPEIGVDNLSRGSLVHTVLELFWKTTESQAALLQLDADALESRLAECAARALERLEKEKRFDLPARQREIEQRRLVALVRRWLDEEKGREAFRVVASETGHQLAIGSLLIRTRVDRIDELADGRHAIIDYKTGQVDLKQWLEDRITEPQLPAYCQGYAREQLGAVMFAVVRGKDRERGFRGLARNGDAWPKDATPRGIDAVFEEKDWHSFDDVLAHWQRVLPALGDAFAGGEAQVDPVDQKLACTYCDLAALCRVSELERVPLNPEGGDD